MSTLSDLKASASLTLRDPSHKTFDDASLGEMVNEALAEVGRLAPNRFQEDITPVANTLSYQLQQSVFTDAIPEIEVSRVELWDASTAPNRFLSLLSSKSTSILNRSDGGWEVWGGFLSLPDWLVDEISTAIHIYRVWGYSPYAPLTADGQVVGVSNELEQAMKLYVKVEGLRRLTMDRDLYTQWATRSNDSDVSPASLMNGLTLAEAAWVKRANAIRVLRVAS